MSQTPPNLTMERCGPGGRVYLVGWIKIVTELLPFEQAQGKATMKRERTHAAK